MLKASYSISNKKLCKLVATCKLPTRFCNTTEVDMMCFDYGQKHNEVIALIHRKNYSSTTVPIVRVHSACITGEIFGSEKCDCGYQFDYSMEQICSSSYGIMLYMMSHEGRGIGIADKIRAYRLQENGANTLEANEMLGLPQDNRDFKPAAEVLKFLHLNSVKLMTNNPNKRLALEKNGIMIIEQIPILSEVNIYNKNYLIIKQNILNHDFGYKIK